MHTYINFDRGIIENCGELVGDDVVIDLTDGTFSLVPPWGDERVVVPIDALHRVELEERPRIVAHKKNYDD